MANNWLSQFAGEMVRQTAKRCITNCVFNKQFGTIVKFEKRRRDTGAGRERERVGVASILEQNIRWPRTQTDNIRCLLGIGEKSTQNGFWWKSFALACNEFQSARSSAVKCPVKIQRKSV